MAKDSNIPSTHPLTPPLTEEAWLDWFRLLRSRRVGVSTFYRLMTEFGCAATALEALPGIAADAGVTNYKVFSRGDAEAEWLAGQRAGARPLAIGSEDYPALLSEIPDAPPLLWTVGNLDFLRRPMTALVGARNASSLGTRMSKKLATDLGRRGHVVVSGMARGIDAAAHIAALPTGTVAVVPGGVDVVYPNENAVLMQEIAEAGLILSDQPMHLKPRLHHFTGRNRIITGLCRATVVVEAASKSGTHGTARTALDQGREVLAVPGHPFDARSAGSNMLIRDGATLIRNAEDLMEALGPETPPKPPETPEPDPIEEPRDLRALHAEILGRLQNAPATDDVLVRMVGGSARSVASEISALELEGRIARTASGQLALAREKTRP